MKARGRMPHTLGPTALIHLTRHKCHGQEFTLTHITNTNYAQQTHNNMNIVTVLSVCLNYLPAKCGQTLSEAEAKSFAVLHEEMTSFTCCH